MTYLLDTNVLSELTSISPSAILRERVRDAGANVVIAAPVLIEARHGALTDRKTTRRAPLLAFYDAFAARYEVLPLDRAAAIEATNLYASLRARPPGWFDCMIAAIARVHRATVVTRDADFLAFDVPVEDWTRDDRILRKKLRG